MFAGLPGIGVGTLFYVLTALWMPIRESVRLVKDRPFTGDFDAMVKRRAIRVGVTFNRTHYFIDKGQERGLTYESLTLFENDRNAA